MSEPKRCPSGPKQIFALSVYLTRRRNQLRKEAGRKGWRQEDVAALIGVTRTTFGRWEAGLEWPGGENLCKWAAALQVELVPVTYS